jgi:prepilin-type processing-associated H-X9-DG protein
MTVSTTFACPSCRGTIAAEGAAGTQVRCPLCNEVVTIPVPTTPPAVQGPPTATCGALPGQPLQQGLAIGSLACGLAGFVTCGLGGLAGIVLGIVALVKANNEPQRYGGKGLAIGGMCAGGMSLMMVPLLISILLPSLSRARELSKRLVCGANMKLIGTSMKIYANDYGGEVPIFESLVASGELFEKHFLCPSSDALIGDLHACYELIPDANRLAGQMNAVWMYEKPDNHGGEGGNVLFTDGHVEFIRGLDKLEELIAETKRRIAEAKAEAGDNLGP